MKPFVKVTFDFGEEVKEVKFTNKENLEELIDTLTAAYAELEHRIEMKRIKNRNKRIAKKIAKGVKAITLQEPKVSDFEGFKKPPMPEDFIKEPKAQKGDFSKVTSYSKALDALEKEDERTLTKMQEDLMKEYECVEKLYNNLPDCKFKSNLQPYLELAKVLLECVKK